MLLARYTYGMRFSTEGVKTAVEAIASAISAPLLQGDKVVWLLSGGSCVLPQVEIMHTLKGLHEAQLTNLSVMLVDERYGSPGHANSNDEQLLQAGFDPGTVRWYKVNAGHSMSETVVAYSQAAADMFASADKVVATLGMGPDAHTAGLLPHSPVFTDTAATVVGYNWSDYQRMTLGIEYLLQVTQTFVLAYGESKRTALTRLQANTEPIEALPAKILYDLPDVTIYNDYIKTEE